MSRFFTIVVRMGVLAVVACALMACHSDADGEMELADWLLLVDGHSTEVRLPTRLDDGRVPSRPMTYRLTRHVSLAPGLRNRDLSIVFRAPGAQMDLRIDGARAVSTYAESSIVFRRRGPNAFLVPAEATLDGQLELELEVTHTWTQTAWFDVVPVLAREERGKALVVRHDWINFVFSIGAVMGLLQVGLTCLAVYFQDRTRRPYLFIGCQSVLASVYPLHVSALSQAVFGHFDAVAVGATLTAAAITSVYFTRSYFGLAPPSRLWSVLLVVAGGVAPIVFRDPFLFTAVIGRSTVLIAAAVVLYQLTLTSIAVARTKDRWSAVVMLAAWVFITITATGDLVRWFGLGDVTRGLRGGQIGLGVFSLAMSALLTRRHAAALKESDALNVELAGRVNQLLQRGREIETLNTELERQVSDRAAQIYAALALRELSAREGPKLASGQIVANRYRILELLGVGGMGAVWRVEKISDGGHLAMKVSRVLDGANLARLAREAQIASAVTHPNVVRIVDVDVSSEGFLFIVMELVIGTSLTQHSKQAKSTRWALTVLGQFAAGLNALHEAGIVHRDLTAGNVLTTGGDLEPIVKITDFGISRLDDELSQSLVRRARESAPAINPTEQQRASATETDAQDRWTIDEEVGDADDPFASGGRTAQLAVPGPAGPTGSGHHVFTQAGRVAGTPLFMAPELVQSEGIVAPSSDLFSYGVLAFELLTGEWPFAESVALAALQGRTVAAPASVSALRKDLPADVSLAIDRCLSIRPAERPTAGDIARIMQSALATLGRAT